VDEPPVGFVAKCVCHRIFGLEAQSAIRIDESLPRAIGLQCALRSAHGSCVEGLCESDVSLLDEGLQFGDFGSVWIASDKFLPVGKCLSALQRQLLLVVDLNRVTE